MKIDPIIHNSDLLSFSIGTPFTITVLLISITPMLSPAS